MMRMLSLKVQAEINAVVDAAVKAGTLVRVYAEAERIRQANLDENIALEDIAEEIMQQSAQGPGFEADLRDVLRVPGTIH